VNRAYIVINTEMGCEKEVKESLSRLPEVKEIHEVHGVYDLIVRVEVGKMSKLKETVSEKVSSLD
jgi:DNA-binding Lrp family transcriptional regulator